MARALRDAGFEVIYTGIRQTPPEIVAAALQEDVAVIGLSILSGAHIGLTRRVLHELRDRSAGDILVVVGGTIPHSDMAKLEAMGAAAIFPTGTPMSGLVETMRALTQQGAGP